jgi:hypothetical protein
MAGVGIQCSQRGCGLFSSCWAAHISSVLPSDTTVLGLTIINSSEIRGVWRLRKQAKSRSATIESKCDFVWNVVPMKTG